MPIYEYECKACGHRMEAIQKISDNLLTDCPECSKPELKKLISASGFRLKGGGWYETDFKSGKKKNVVQESGKSGGGDSSKKNDSSGNAKADSAPKNTKASGDS
jgi:putative FmdB family regulatory protein